MTFLAILIYCLYSFISNIVTNDSLQNCDKPGTLAFLCQVKVKGAMDNKKNQNNLILIQMWLGFVFCLVWSVGARLIRVLGRKKAQKIDDLLESSSDNNIFIEKLPVGDYHERELLEFLNELWEKI